MWNGGSSEENTNRDNMKEKEGTERKMVEGEVEEEEEGQQYELDLWEGQFRQWKLKFIN